MLIDPSELKYEIAVDSNRLIIKLFRLCWGKDTTITFCRLFWGTLFCWLPLIGMAGLFSFLAPIYVCFVLPTNKLKERRKEKRSQRAQARILNPPPPKPVKPKKEHPWRERILAKLEAGGTRLVMWIQHKLIPFWNGHLKEPVRWGLIGIVLANIAGFAIWGLIEAVIALAALPLHIWSIIGQAALGLVGGLVGGLLTYLLACLVHEREYDERAFEVVKRPALGSWGVFMMAYRAVKTNTCPRIVVRND